jgi:hypothetical protein
MNDLAQTIQQMPWTAMAPVGLLMVLGLLLWARGRKVLRTGFALAGLIVGGAAGWVLGESLNIGIPPWVTAIMTGILLCCVAALAYRFAMGVALALVLGAAAPLSVLTLHEWKGVPSQSALDKMNEQSADAIASVKADGDAAKATVRNALDNAELALGLEEDKNEQLELLRTYAQQLFDAVHVEWGKTPESLRPTLIASGVIGFVIGGLLGVLFPAVSASIVTAFGGSMLWLGSAHILLLRAGAGDSFFMPRSSMTWLMVWLAASIIGLALQWILRGKPEPKADKAG